MLSIILRPTAESQGPFSPAGLRQILSVAPVVQNLQSNPVFSFRDHRAGWKTFVWALTLLVTLNMEQKDRIWYPFVKIEQVCDCFWRNPLKHNNTPENMIICFFWNKRRKVVSQERSFKQNFCRLMVIVFLFENVFVFSEGMIVFSTAQLKPDHIEIASTSRSFFAFPKWTVSRCAMRQCTALKAHSHRASTPPTLSVHTPLLFSHVQHWQCDADGNADAGKNRDLLDFIPGNVAVTLTLTLTSGVNGPWVCNTASCTRHGRNASGRFQTVFEPTGFSCSLFGLISSQKRTLSLPDRHFEAVLSVVPLPCPSVSLRRVLGGYSKWTLVTLILCMLPDSMTTQRRWLLWDYPGQFRYVHFIVHWAVVFISEVFVGPLCPIHKGTGRQSVVVCVGKYPGGKSWQ